MGMKSYVVGKTFEGEILDYYNDLGYFVYKMPTQIVGTVFDILAIKNSSCLAIECKHVEGDKLLYKSSGIAKKRDELNHFVDTCNTNVYIYIKSEKLGSTYWTTWARSGKLLETKGYLDLEQDCFKANLDASKIYASNKVHNKIVIK